MERELPEDWELVTLDEIANWGSGGTPNRAIASYYEGDIPWIKTGDLNDGVIKEASEFITELGLQKSSAKLFPKGSICIAMYGATIGKTAILGIEAATNQACAVAQAHEGIVNKFLHYFLKSEKDKFIEKGKGGAQPNISQKVIKLHEFPLPPLAEQKRIVAKLDEAFQHLDSIKSRWEGIISLHSKYIKACLVDKEEDAFYAREKLAEYLEESTERIGVDWQNKTKVGVSAQKGIIELETGQKETFEKYKIVRPGGFVYNAMRVNIGSIAIYEGDEIGITSPDYIVFRVKKDLSPKLLLGFLKSEMGFLEINANTKGSVRSRLYFKNLVNINYPIAPLRIQEQAEQVLAWYSSALSKWRKTIEPSLAVLSQAILAKAFRGELVPQSPTDEPATVLLEKIKAAKAAALKPAKGKKAEGGKQGELVL
ncbi:restriction endonuclease subunit S [Pontibacter sp. CAU 1760]